MLLNNHGRSLIFQTLQVIQKSTELTNKNDVLGSTSIDDYDKIQESQYA